MQIKVDGVDIVVNLSNFREILNYIQVQKEKAKTQKRKAIATILKDRRLLNKYINKSDKELKKELKELNKTSINYDRQFMFKSKIPFIITN